MRNRIKAIISFMAAVFVISSFSIIVSANTKIDSGTVSNDKGSYNWEYYEDNLLVITPKNSDLLIDEADLPSGYLTSSTTIHIDVSNLYNHSYLGYQYGLLNVYGDGCPTGNIEISGKTLYNFFNMTFRNFPILSSVSFQEDTSFYWIGLYDCNVEDIDIFENLDFKSLEVSGSENLITANVPDGLESVSIYDCENLKYLNSIENLENIHLYSLPSLDELTIPSATTDCTLIDVGITEITVPKTCTYFSISSDSLKKAIIGESTEVFRQYMFTECNNLEQVVIPDSVTVIEQKAIDKCENLKRIDIPASVTQIDLVSFHECYSLEKIYYSGTREQWLSIKLMDYDAPVTWRNIDGCFCFADIYYNDVTIITSEPEDFKGTIGTTATFEVEATGDNLEYQWQYANPIYFEWIDIDESSAKTALLEIQDIDNYADKRIRCLITDSTGKTYPSHTARIIVIEAVIINEQPVDLTCKAGETAEFTVEADGDELNYQWMVLKNGEWANCSNKDGAKTATLKLEAKESRNGSTYKCVITDNTGFSATTNQVKLTVTNPLTVETQPVDFYGVAGETATFTVVAKGSGLKYQWQTFKNGSWTNCSINDGAKTDTLSLEIKSSRNGSKYQCVITDKNGDTVTTDTVTLTIGAPLKIVTQPEDYSGAAGETATFTVAAEGTGLKYQWQTLKNGSWTNCSINDGAKTATLTLAIKDSRNGSKYQCVITDKNGAAVTTETVTLTVKKEVIIVTEPSDYCAYVLGETATFTIEAEGEGLKYQWQVLKNGAWTNCSINDGAKTKTLSLEVKSSRDGSEYRCVVTDKYGNSAESITVTLTIAKTLEPTDPNDLPPIEINPVNATAAEIDFTAADCVDITEIVEVAEVVEAAEVIETVSEIETVTDID